MRPSLRIGVAVALAAVVVVAVGATWNARANQDQHERARMSNKMKTVCVGRFLIDMPEEAQVELSHARIRGFNIAAFGETFDEFQKRLAEREAQIRAKHDQLGGNKNLETSRLLISFACSLCVAANKNQPAQLHSSFHPQGEYE